MTEAHSRYDNNVVGYYVNVFRSDHQWHLARVAQFNEETRLHFIEFLIPKPILSGSTDRLDECEKGKGDYYDLNNPSRRLRWYATNLYSSLIQQDHVLPASITSQGSSRRSSREAAAATSTDSKPPTTTAAATLPIPELSSHYSQRVLPSTGSVLATSTVSGSRYIVGMNNKLIKIYAPAARATAASPSAASAEQPKTPQEWKALQQAALTEDPSGLLYRRIRVFWPVDHASYSGRVLKYNPQNNQHFVQYDDGEQRWYVLSTREYTLLEDRGPEIVGRRVVVEMSRSKWYVARITAYEPDVCVHKLEYEDFPGEEEYADINARGHEWLVDVSALPAGERILGRRISVYWSRPAAFFPATITEYTPFMPVGSVMATPLGTKVLPVSRNVHGTPYTPQMGADGGAGVEAEVHKLDLEDGGSNNTHSASSRPPHVMRHPSYVPVEIAPDPSATIKIVYDDGDKQTKQLGDIRFIWLTDRCAGRPIAPGAVGLLNMGNTCYLNSILQCLSRVDQLAAYCTDESFSALINTRNDSGMGGRMALAFADLIRDLCGEDTTALAPGFVKALLSEKNTLFNGMGQQDAHEALMCLLDAVHEDLAVPDHAATAAAVTDAQLAAEEEEKEKSAKDSTTSTATTADMKRGVDDGRPPEPVVITSVGKTGVTASLSPTAILSSALAPTPTAAVAINLSNAVLASSGVAATPVNGAANGSISSSAVSDGTPQPTLILPEEGVDKSNAVSVAASSDHKEGVDPIGVVENGSSTSVVSKQPRKLPSETTSIVKQLFFVHMHVEYTCSRSRHVSVKHGPRGGEMLPPLSVASKKWTKGGLFKKKTAQDPSVEDCLGEYFKEEAVERKCDKCGVSTTVMARAWLNALPPVLVVQLKRFEYQPAEGIYVKISEPVSFPLEGLNMSAYVHDYNPLIHGSAVYDLFAAVVHVGSTDRGHYTTYARTIGSNGWYHFDDAKVTPVTPADVTDVNVTRHAYVLFYAKRLPSRAMHTNRSVFGMHTAAAAAKSAATTTKSSESSVTHAATTAVLVAQ